MYKSKLQILCQCNSWGLPEYSTTKCGHDRNPSFTATVAVNGVRFNTTDESRNSKEAQDKAAKIAFEHLSSANPYSTFPQPSLVAALSSPPVPASSDMSHLYKHRLQNYPQKRNLPMPEYSTEHEGPHAIRFKSKVTIDGQSYWSPEFTPTLKEAEHAAAKVALESLLVNEVQEDDSGLYKNLVRHLAEKEGLDVIYETNVSGPPHMPTFVSTVVIRGQPFEGQPAKSKKQAETNAAKVAYTGLQEYMSHLYKHRLQNYAQKRNLPMPEYSTEHEGPHAIRFKSKVTIDGKSYWSPEFTPTLKEAEHAAAKVALESLLVNEVQEDDSGLYKNLVRHLAEKEGLDVIYETNVSGPPHMPTFVSTVVIRGQPFEGQPAKSKTQAETNAAKVAYTGLQEYMSHLYKHRLQNYAQKRNLPMPEYSTEHEGPHAIRFKSKVTIDGKSYWSPEFTPTLKEAEHAAAKVALESLLVNEVQEDDSGLYKNLVRHLAEKEGLDVIYETNVSGPPHMPTFVSTVVIRGQPFEGQPAKSKTQAETNAAKVAYTGLQEYMSHLYKHRLQNYAQKRNLPMPEYSTEHEGPHAIRFKSKVTIDGKSYWSPEFTPTLKEAEHAAAKVALESLLVNEVQEDDSGLYKNLVRHLAEKEGLDVIYETNVSGPPHMPTFVSTVVIRGQPFEGQPAKSKKQAETNAAKVAYTGLQECRASVMPMNLSSGCQIKEALEVSSSILQSVIAGDLQQSSGPKANLITRKEQSKEDAGDVFPGDLQQTAEPTATLVIWEEQDKDYIAGHEDNCSSNLTTSNAEVNNRHAAPPPPDADINLKRHRCSTPAEILHASLRDPSPSTFSSPEDGFSLPLMHSQSSKNSTLDSHNEIPIGAANGKNTLPREKILIHPRKPNMTFPEGANVLPFSDDKWVAMKMNPSQQ